MGILPCMTCTFARSNFREHCQLLQNLGAADEQGTTLRSPGNLKFRLPSEQMLTSDSYSLLLELPRRQLFNGDLDVFPFAAPLKSYGV